MCVCVCVCARARAGVEVQYRAAKLTYIFIFLVLWWGEEKGDSLELLLLVMRVLVKPYSWRLRSSLPC